MGWYPFRNHPTGKELMKTRGICARCGNDFDRRGTNAKYCGHYKDKGTCAYLAHNESICKLKKQTPLCKICGIEFHREYKNRGQRYCEVCSKVARKEVVDRSQSKNRDSRLQRTSDWRVKNWDHVLEYKKQYHQKRLEDPEYKILHNLRSRMYHALMKNQKSEDTKTLIGCTIPELRAHIDDQMVEGMSWDNYSKFGWHIDHIKPCSSFDLSDTEQQKQCFHYTNLQPLWATENLQKSNKY